MPTSTTDRSPLIKGRDADLPRWLHWTLWGLQIFGAAVFAFAGVTKLAGLPQTIETFEAIGFGQGFRYLTGALEVLGAVLIIVPRTAWIGGALLACIMAGAVLTHLFLIGGSFLPALVLFVLGVVVAWFRR